MWNFWMRSTFAKVSSDNAKDSRKYREVLLDSFRKVNHTMESVKRAKYVKCQDGKMLY